VYTPGSKADASTQLSLPRDIMNYKLMKCETKEETAENVKIRSSQKSVCDLMQSIIIIITREYGL